MYYYHYYEEPAAQVQVGKTELLINCFRNPTNTCATENWRKFNSGRQPMVDCTFKPIQRSDVKHSVGKVSNLGRHIFEPCRKHVANFDVLHLNTLNSNGWAAAAARVCQSLVDAERRSLNRQWFEFEPTLYNKHCPAIWSLDTTTWNSVQGIGRCPQMYVSPTSK